MLICANWKMNLNQEKALNLFRELLKVNSTKNEIIIFPTSLSIYDLASELEKSKNKIVKLGVQNFYPKEEGAFTGEITLSELPENIDYCLIGHSERRLNLKETDDFIEEKVNFAVNHGKKVILCIGEALEIKKSGKTIAFLLDQLKSALKMVSSLENIAIAYEPIWSIGTGLTPTNEEIEEVILEVQKHYPTSVLYGGSVAETNILTLKNIKNLAGFLIGGASLNLEKFEKIVSTLD